MKKKVVFVGMSGGVDSSVSAAILKQQGYEVVGVFIRTWHPDFLTCNEGGERLDAMRVAAFLNIPFLTFDFEEVYKREVADYMISEYKLGRTPNPDVMCNKEVKFGAFFKKALSMGADFIATGHYCQISGKGQTLRRNLLKAKDSSKDQAYFLWTLKQAQLSKILFPVGHLNKTEVRKLAKKFNLPVAEKKDSQGICFLGAVDLKDFLKHYIEEKKGKVLNERGEEIGWHNGVVFFTLGERHGFNITQKTQNDKPYYIVGKDVKKNILYVSQGVVEKRSVLREERSDSKGLALKKLDKNSDRFFLDIFNTNWISEIPKDGKKYTAQIRYHGEFLPCKIKYTGEPCDTQGSPMWKVFFKKHILVASGQSCVIYDKEVCLGGGVVI